MTTKSEEENVTEENTVETMTGVGAIERGLFAGIMLPVSLLIFFISSWVCAYIKGGWYGIFLNSILMTVVAILGAKHCEQKNVDEEEE